MVPRKMAKDLRTYGQFRGCIRGDILYDWVRGIRMISQSETPGMTKCDSWVPEKLLGSAERTSQKVISYGFEQRSRTGSQFQGANKRCHFLTCPNNNRIGCDSKMMYQWTKTDHVVSSVEPSDSGDEIWSRRHKMWHRSGYGCQPNPFKNEEGKDNGEYLSSPWAMDQTRLVFVVFLRPAVDLEKNTKSDAFSSCPIGIAMLALSPPATSCSVFEGTWSEGDRWSQGVGWWE